MESKIKIGISLFSLTPLYVSRKMSFEDCLKAAHDMGFEGVEIVAAQMVPEYPNPSDEWLEYCKEQITKHQLKLVTWSAYVDMGIRSDRDLTTEEIVQYTRNDLIYAKKVGAEIVRTQHAITPEIFRKMLPFCKELDIKLTIEMHSPHHPDVPVWKEYLDIMAEPETEGYLGVVPDFSIFQYTPHKLAIDSYIAGGCRHEKLKQIINDHNEGLSAEEIIAGGDYSDDEIKSVHDIKHRFNAPAKVDDFRKLLPYAPYIHGKFHYLTEECSDPTIPYEELLKMMVEFGYEGYIACEFEGHSFEEDPRIQLKRFVTMVNRILKKF